MTKTVSHLTAISMATALTLVVFSQAIALPAPSAPLAGAVLA